MLSLSQSPRRTYLLKLLAVIFVLAIAVVPVIPNYFTGRWSWNTTPKVPYLSQLRQLKTEGLMVPGWKTVSQSVVNIGGHEWLAQTIAPDTPETQALFQTPVLLLLRPQTWYRDLPQVDWMDINGSQRWTADSLSHLTFAASVPSTLPSKENQGTSSTPAPESASTPIQARFFRGWTTEQTFAVLQWYAWINGGNAAPSAWFWADQRSQWSDRHKMPWIAVSILIPMKPVGNIKEVESQAETLGKTLQTAVATHVFVPGPSS